MLRSNITKYLITISSLVILLYGTFVFRHVFYKPTITLNHPALIETNEPIITISGSVKHITSLTVNTKPLLFEQTGHFEQTRTLEDGTSTIILEGSDRFGRKTEQTILIHKEPADIAPPSDANSEETSEEESIEKILDQRV